MRIKTSIKKQQTNNYTRARAAGGHVSKNRHFGLDHAGFAQRANRKAIVSSLSKVCRHCPMTAAHPVCSKHPHKQATTQAVPRPDAAKQLRISHQCSMQQSNCATCTKAHRSKASAQLALAPPSGEEPANIPANNQVIAERTGYQHCGRTLWSRNACLRRHDRIPNK
jgi:hypothetical protein